MPRKTSKRAAPSSKALVPAGQTKPYPIASTMIEASQIFHVPQRHPNGEGPWQNEADKIAWTDSATGLPCTILRSEDGTLGGYVGVRDDHPLFGFTVDAIPGALGISPHGGLDYAATCQRGPEETSICHPSPAAQKTRRPSRGAALASGGGSTGHEPLWWFGFNNILAAILSSIRLARRRIEKGENADDFLSNAAHAAERGATLTQRMLAFARKQELKLESVDLKASVNGMTELLQRTIGPNISIHRNFPKHLSLVTADAAQIELAVMNLVVNARDAMPNGGNIVITATEVAPEGDGETLVELSVRDTGEGMDADTQARAMDPFFTTKEVGNPSLPGSLLY